MTLATAIDIAGCGAGNRKKGLEFKHVVLLESDADYEGIKINAGSFTAGSISVSA